MKKLWIWMLLAACLAPALFSGCGQRAMDMDTGAFAQYAATVDGMVLPQTYRIYAAPEYLYDAMIFVPDATPTEILP